MQLFKSRTLHCRNPFKFFSFVLIKEVTFQRSILWHVVDPGKWQCVAGLPAIAARFAEAMLPRARQCGKHSVSSLQWSEPQSPVILVTERGTICSLWSHGKIPHHAIKYGTNRLIMMRKYSELQSIWWLLVDIRWLSEKYGDSNRV